MTRSRLTALWRRLGWTGLAGVVLAAAGLSAEVFVREPMIERTAALSERVSRSARAASDPSASAASELERFYAHLRRDSDINDWLAVVYALAAGRGVELGTADYRLLPDSVLALNAYEIQLPLKGSYESIWGFAENVLEEVPVAALSAIKLSRKASAGTEVDAELRFTLYVPSR